MPPRRHQSRKHSLTIYALSRELCTTGRVILMGNFRTRLLHRVIVLGGGHKVQAVGSLVAEVVTTGPNQVSTFGDSSSSPRRLPCHLSTSSVGLRILGPQLSSPQVPLSSCGALIPRSGHQCPVHYSCDPGLCGNVYVSVGWVVHCRWP
jgi:hypothetical protein